MVSAFQDEIRGFGFEMTSEELARVNAFRSVNGRPALKDTPGTRFLEYGKNKDGYWNYDMFAEQCVDVMDCFEVLYPGLQLVMDCLLYTSPSPRDATLSRMPSSA